MEQERSDDKLAVPDLIDHHTADDNSKAEAGESRATDVTQLSGGETKISRPIGENAATDAEADAGRKDRHEACKQQPLCIRGYALVTFTHRGVRVLILCYDKSDVERQDLPTPSAACPFLALIFCDLTLKTQAW